jgi:hypothetical protein
MLYGAFLPKTLTFFQQSTAPTGWVIQTSNTDYTLRVVNGSTGGTMNSGGAFSTTMVSSTWPVSYTGVTYTIGSTAADLPSHTHTFANVSVPGPYSVHSATTPGSHYLIAASSYGAGTTVTGGPGGSGSPHSHSSASAVGSVTGGTANFAVYYVDLILASKS